MIPIDTIRKDRNSLSQINQINYIEILPENRVKRSLSNGIELLKLFIENDRKYRCRINFNIGNLAYLNSTFIIQDDVSKFSVTNISTNGYFAKLNGSVLLAQINITGIQNFIVTYDFVPSNLVGMEQRNVAVYSGSSNALMIESTCLQRANFADSVSTNGSLIVACFLTFILVVVIFIILWLFYFRGRYLDNSIRETTKTKVVNYYTEDLQLLTNESSKTYYEKVQKTKTTTIVHNDYSQFDSDLSNAREMDEKLQNDFGRLDDVVFLIWLNSIGEQMPHLRDKLNQISRQRNSDRDNIKKLIQNKITERFAEIKRRIIEKNNVNLSRLQMNQDEERERILNMVTDNDKEEVVANLEKLFESQQRDVAVQLKVEQEKAFEDEKLKWQAQMVEDINKNQIEHVNALINKSGLSQEDSDEIMKRYIQWQQKLQGVNENEKIRQAAAIAYLLENRINQDKKREFEDQSTKELLDKKNQYFVNAISELVDNDDISPDISSKILTQFEHDKEQILIEMEKSKKTQVEALLERLNEEKRKKLEDLKAKQENEINNIIAIHSTDTDAQSLIKESVDLKFHHRDEITSTEAEIYDNTTSELVNLLQEIGIQTLNKLDERIVTLSSELKKSGFSDYDLEDIFADSNKRIRNIQKIQNEERIKQEQALQKRLQKIKAEIEENAKSQAKDQSIILEAHNEVMDEITAMQKTLSDDERHRIMELFSKNQSSMENNLVNLRIVQRRKMEEAMNAKKEEKLMKLEKSHSEEMKEIIEKGSKNKGPKYTEDAISKCVSDFVFAKLKISTEENSQKELDKEMERIRKEILEERVVLIHRKEEEIASLLNRFQMDKATLHVELKEQQEKLKELQMVVLDTFDKDKSVSNVINKHDRDKEILTDAIDMNKRRQEEELQRRIIRKKKKTLLGDDNLGIEGAQNQEVSQIRKQNIENEILQSNLKSEDSINKFEIEFLKSIMDSGNFPRSEVLVVLREKFPLKTNHEIEIMAEEMYPKSKEKAQPQKSLIESYKKITDKDKSRPASSMSILSNERQSQTFEESLSSSKRPLSVGRQRPSLSANIAMPILAEDLDEESPTIIKPKKKRKKRREVAEVNENEYDGM